MVFLSREQAGQELGRHLFSLDIQGNLVLGLPRGGVVVAAAVAQVLSLPLDVLVVRKIGHPRNREFAVGALAEPEVVQLDQAFLRSNRVNRFDLDAVIAEETDRLRAYQTRFHPGGSPVLANKQVLLIDDGLATGATMEAAVVSAKKQGAGRVTVAVPVAASEGAARLRRIADEVIALVIDPDFLAVGQYYEYFPQTTDEEVLGLLPANA